MKKTVLIVLMSILLLQGKAGFSSVNDSIPLSRLEGTWYINKSNFKMWFKKHNHNPSFNYFATNKNNIGGLKDVVAYRKRQKAKKITGFDRPLNDDHTKFEWRGKGILFLFKSEWEILYLDSSVMIIHFQKTLFTAEGYDVVSREKTLNPTAAAIVDLKLKQFGVPELKAVKQD